MIEPVNLSDTEIIQPYWTCSLEEGMSTIDFTSRSCQSIELFLQRLRPRMDSKLYDIYPPLPMENMYRPLDEYRTLNGDGLVSVCMKVHDEARRHKIALYDHVTKELKHIGQIPRHRFEMSIDTSVFSMDDPVFVEGVIGAMTHDAQFVAVLAHSKNLCVLSVFNIPNALCLCEKDLPISEFGKDFQPTGVALVPAGVSKSQFNIAVLGYKMEVRVWNSGSYMGKAVKLEDTRPSFVPSKSVINPRESFLRFSPNGQYLCVLANIESCMCIVMDSISLQPLYRMPYSFTYGQLCSIFPCFTVCGSRFAMFTPPELNRYWDLDAYQLHFFRIPQAMQCLKDLCRLSVLSHVDRSNLSKLPLPQNLILFLGGNEEHVSESANSHKKCHLM
ncbi:uncharacterized protein LOC114526336 [Dendronephthya gigantea]|uniref:uncharacterized protein LOC114526336 n=1 Tax=Dendronephthya gigantea TaxID=151771 RepID=UPI0010690FC5|nr:uncharacterized protein LOC114526336 [Dendronephthya gigantea]